MTEHYQIRPSRIRKLRSAAFRFETGKYDRRAYDGCDTGGEGVQ